MKVSYNWIKEFLNIDLDYTKVSEILTDTGLEIGGVEEFQSIKGGLEGIVIGEVLTCEKHSNADTLSVTTVDIGNGNILPIVCGAPNVAAGQKVVVSTVGTTLYDGDEGFKIKKSKIRGEVSEGMICAEDELGLGTSHDGIMVLDSSIENGTLAKNYFKIENDIIFDIDLTPNRIDAASHYGVARDLAAYLKQNENVEFKNHSVDNFTIDNNNLPIEVIVENQEACKRYSGLTISNITVKESPDWLKNRLKSIGLTPINNIVDITNYILQEQGQPLHAFDADKISGNKVIVKMLSDKTKFTTLDEQERELSDKDLMICNDSEGMCIAGVFGGAESGVTETTKNIFLESAYFDSVYVRKTAKRHGLNTDASFRFERGTDPNNTVFALKRAAILIKELAGGEISSDIIDVYTQPVENKIVDVKYSHITRLIGKDLGNDNIKNILEGLEIKIISEQDDELKLEIPAYRVDVTREADVIEEILRIYGYNNIEISDSVKSALSYVENPDKNKIKNIISDMLSSAGFSEMMSNSLTKAKYYTDNENYKDDETVKILNPLSIDLDGMRQSLLFGGLEAISFNKNRKNKDLKLYEFGNTYFLKGENNENSQLNYKEQSNLALFLTGNKNKVNWNLEAEPSTFFELKAYTENILLRLGFDLSKLNKMYNSKTIFAESVLYLLNNKAIVEFGVVDTKITKDFDIDDLVYYAEFDWNNLLKLSVKNKLEYKPISKYPEVKRDLALLLDKSISFEQIVKLANKSEKRILKTVSMFDYFEGEKIGKEKKSYGVSFTLQDENKTLTDKQIDKVMRSLINIFQRELGAEIR